MLHMFGHDNIIIEIMLFSSTLRENMLFAMDPMTCIIVKLYLI